MSQINGKYLKDENGNIFSPITSTQSIFDNDGISLKNLLLRFKTIKVWIRNTNRGSSKVSYDKIEGQVITSFVIGGAGTKNTAHITSIIPEISESESNGGGSRVVGVHVINEVVQDVVVYIGVLYRV